MSAYRDIAARFADADAQVLGATIDPAPEVKKFADSLKLPFPILADQDGALAKAYGVEKGGYADRVTFVIGKDGNVIKVISGPGALDPAPALGSCPLPKRKAKS
jgi:peroxiredoxin Q/BCP